MDNECGLEGSQLKLLKVFNQESWERSQGFYLRGELCVHSFALFGSDVVFEGSCVSSCVSCKVVDTAAQLE